MKWNILNTGFKLILRLFSTILFMRWIDPEIYGQYTISVIVIEGLRYIVDKGYGGAIVQNPTVSIQHANYLLKNNVKASLVVFMLIAPIPFLFFYDIRFQLIFLFVSLIFFAATVVPHSLLRKEMAFKRIMIFDLISLLVSIVISIPLAINGYGLWALVCFYFVNVFLSCLFYFNSLMRAKKGIVQEPLISFSGYNTSIMINNVFIYFSSNFDQILITSLFGASLQGIYNRAIIIMSTPVTSVVGSISEVLTSTLSPESLGRRRNIYFKSLRTILVILVPFLFSIYLVINNCLLSLVGERWLFIINFSSYIILATFPMALNYLFGSILISSGKKNLVYQGMILKRTTEFSFLIVGAFWGVTGLLTSKVLIEFVKLGINFYQTKEILDVDIKYQLTHYLEPIIVIVVSLFLLNLSIPFYLTICLIIIFNFLLYWFLDKPLMVNLMKEGKELFKMD